jgi:hypothetical protein
MKHRTTYAMTGSDDFGPVSRDFAALVIRQWRTVGLRVRVTRMGAHRAYYCRKLDQCLRIGC